MVSATCGLSACVSQAFRLWWHSLCSLLLKRPSAEEKQIDVTAEGRTCLCQKQQADMGGANKWIKSSWSSAHRQRSSQDKALPGSGGGGGCPL